MGVAHETSLGLTIATAVLSYRSQLAGWRFVYLPGLDCPSELPVETYSFQVQQSRWAKGLTQVAMKLLPRILKAQLPARVKAEAFFHLTANFNYPLMIVLSVLMFPAMVVRYNMGWTEMLLIDIISPTGIGSAAIEKTAGQWPAVGTQSGPI